MSKPLGAKGSSIKVVLVGPSNAGKTSIAKRFTTDQFDEFQDMTVGSAFFSKQVQSVTHQTSVRVEVWDTAGQEKYRAMAPMYFRNAAGAILVFDLSTPSSFDDIEKVWLPELLPHMKNSTQFVVLCGNKCDTVNMNDAVTGQLVTKVKAMCASRNILYFNTSAKTGTGVTEVFTHLVDDIVDFRLKEAATGLGTAQKSDKSLQPVSVSAPEKTAEKKESCCK